LAIHKAIGKMEQEKEREKMGVNRRYAPIPIVRSHLDIGRNKHPRHRFIFRYRKGFKECGPVYRFSGFPAVQMKLGFKISES